MLSCVAAAALAVAGEEGLSHEEAPLAGTIDALAWGSARGEPEAACRLAMELVACAIDLPVSRGRAIYDPGPGTDREEFREWTSRVYREADGREAQLEAHCAGAPTASPQVLMSAFRRAALLGSVEAMRFYVRAKGWMGENWQDAGPEEAAWKAHVMPVSWALFYWGDLGIAGSLWYGHLIRPHREVAVGEGDDVAEESGEDLLMVLALMRYSLDTREAAFPRPNEDERWRNDQTRYWIQGLESEEASSLEREAARALAAKWIAGIPRLSAQERESDRVRLRTSNWQHGTFASRKAACHRVIPMP